MKKVAYSFVIFTFFLSFSVFSQFSPIQLSNQVNTASCSAGGNFSVSVPDEVLSGDNIYLNIGLPGTLPDTCSVDIGISFSSPNNKLQYIGSPVVSMNMSSGNTLTASNSLPGNDGQNFNVWFRFANHITCDGETGTFVVTFTTCQGVCEVSVQVTARAGNYWTIEKEYMSGDLRCGISNWMVKIINNNPNPSGYGNYKISGIIYENVSYPVVGNASYTVSSSYYPIYRYFTLLNCTNASTLFNTVDYNFNFGDNCGSSSGSVISDTIAIQSPNASINLFKFMVSNYGGNAPLPAGCEGKYIIRLHNNGNVPWSINKVTDIFPSNLTYLSYANTSDFNLIQTGNVFEFTPVSAPFVLNPGQTYDIVIDFTVNTGVPSGTLVSNTAIIEYQAVGVAPGSSGQGGQACSSEINCPDIDSRVIVDTVKHQFTVGPAVPKEKIKKCIVNPPPGKIYNIGDTIRFKYVIRNTGAGALNTVLNDPMTLPGQNLQAIPGSETYAYYENLYAHPNNIYTCNPAGTGLPSPINFQINSDFSNPQNPVFNISGMPGSCQYMKGNYLVIEFDAVILGQIYGNKTNTVTSSNGNSASVNYTIDQYGILEVNKHADSESVEDGDTFNYIIEVTNNGSVPLNNIVVNDSLPDCIRLLQGIQVRDALNNPVNFTLSGSLQITVDPMFQLNPPETLTIIIPAQKIGSGLCCNETVTARGTMVTSQVVLEANYGSSTAPASCVKSEKCCEIENFNAVLYENPDQTYALQISGGNIPLQEISIQVVDHHVTYNDPACRPDDLGIFGTLTTSTSQLGGLLLDSGSNGTSVLTWELGQASVIQSTVDINISKPNVIDLDCCEAQYYFCLKITAKDVDCNQCEWIVCPENRGEPCDINVSLDKREYCLNDLVQVSWQSQNTSGGCVNLYLIAPGGNITQIASGLSANGQTQWQIPSNLKECNTVWKIVAADCENPKECNAVKEFYLKCCDVCHCGEWKGKNVLISSGIATDTIGDPPFRTEKYFDAQLKRTKVNCGDTVILQKNVNYTFTAPHFACIPDSLCQADYAWQITSGSYSNALTGNPVTQSFTQYGVYTVEIIPECNGKPCEPCRFYVKIEDCVQGDCVMYEDFQDDRPGSFAGWQVINASNQTVQSQGDNQYITFQDGSGASWAYTSGFPSNLIAAGCELHYDVWFYANAYNNTVTTNSIHIYQGTSPANSTLRAYFKLNNASAIVSSATPNFQTIVVPLELATLSGGLPSNSYGQWMLVGASSPLTPADIANFNTLIQNISGIAFFLDTGSNPAEIWRFDNFCFVKTCCKKNNEHKTD